jgi:hypothetical protein
VRVLVCGSRSYSDANTLHGVLRGLLHEMLMWDTWKVVHGGAVGADMLAGAWAGDQAEAHPAKWDHCGPSCPPFHRRQRRGGGDYCPTAGHRRNQEMLDSGVDLVIAFVDKPLEESRGTRDMVERAKGAGVKTIVVWS